MLRCFVSSLRCFHAQFAAAIQSITAPGLVVLVGQSWSVSLVGLRGLNVQFNP
jgi:hypothetical protein